MTIKLRASKLRNAAVTWLATGNVTIAGTLDLSGAAGPSLNTNSAAQFAANLGLPEPGPGGYTGGLGARGSVGPQSGAGPGGGPPGVVNGTWPCYGGSASYINPGYQQYSQAIGPTYGSYLLVPLYGGSGGGGGWGGTAAAVGGIGGAGGGALRIASNTQITVTGTINASGGTWGSVTGSTAGCTGGPGAGGAIHLVAPAIAGNGSLNVNSGADVYYNNIATTGIVRFSMNTNTFTGTVTGGAVVGALYLPPANSSLGAPSLVISSINGVPVPAQASGQVLSPDVTINATSAVTVSVAARNIPVGTIVSLRITGNNAADTVVSCNPLAGTAASSTATCSATFPFSISIASIRATW